MPGGVHPPLSVILSWPKPNYANPESAGNGIVVVSIFLTSVATTLVSLRLYSRICLIHQPGLDDILIVVGLLFAILLTALILVAYYHYGAGIHIWDVKLDRFANARFVTWLCQFCMVLNTSATKISILLFYRRLATGSYTKGFLWAVWIGIAFNLAYCIGFVLYIAFMCSPPDAYWEQFSLTWTKKFTCANEHISLPVAGALSVVGDFYATILPALLLRNLQMPKKQKWLLYALFATGFLVVAAGIVRTIYMDIVINRTYDTTWTLWKVWIWTLVESYLSIMCACGPAIKPLYVKYLAPTVHEAYSYARSRQSVGKSRDRSVTRESRKAFANMSHTSHRSISHAHISSGRAMGEKGTEMGIVVRSDIEQVEERSSDDSIVAHAEPVARTWG